MKLVYAAALLLGGCASSSGVYEVSPGVYTVTSSAITSFGGAGTAKGNALKQAQATCAAKGLPSGHSGSGDGHDGYRTCRAA
jgi:hypothetical protein